MASLSLLQGTDSQSSGQALRLPKVSQQLGWEGTPEVSVGCFAGLEEQLR